MGGSYVHRANNENDFRNKWDDKPSHRGTGEGELNDKMKRAYVIGLKTGYNVGLPPGTFESSRYRAVI